MVSDRDLIQYRTDLKLHLEELYFSSYPLEQHYLHSQVCFRSSESNIFILSMRHHNIIAEYCTHVTTYKQCKSAPKIKNSFNIYQ